MGTGRRCAGLPVLNISGITECLHHHEVSLSGKSPEEIQKAVLSKSRKDLIDD
jgi:hypothetical protein